MEDAGALQRHFGRESKSSSSKSLKLQELHKRKYSALSNSDNCTKPSGSHKRTRIPSEDSISSTRSPRPEDRPAQMSQNYTDRDVIVNNKDADTFPVKGAANPLGDLVQIAGTEKLTSSPSLRGLERKESDLNIQPEDQSFRFDEEANETRGFSDGGGSDDGEFMIKNNIDARCVSPHPQRIARPRRPGFPHKGASRDLKGASQSHWRLRASDYDDNGTRLLNALINAEIEEDLQLRNLHKAKQHYKHLSLTRFVKPEQFKQPPSLLDMESRVEILGRDFQPLSRDNRPSTKPNETRTVLRIQDAGGPQEKFHGPIFAFSVPFQEYSDRNLDYLEQIICNALNRVPGALDPMPPNFALQKDMILQAALARMLNSHNTSDSHMTMEERLQKVVRRGIISYRSYVRYVSSDGSLHKQWVGMTTRIIRADVAPFPVPGFVVFKEPEISTGLTANEQIKHELALKHLKYLVWSLDGRLMSQAQVKLFYASYQIDAATLKAGLHSVGASMMAKTRFSIARARIIKVKSVWIEGWSQCNFLQGYLDAARAADAIDMEIERAELTDSQSCNCADDERAYILHDCHRCEALIPCIERQWSEEMATMCCATCLTKESAPGQSGKQRMMANIRSIALIERRRGGSETALEDIQQAVTNSPYFEDWERFGDEYSSSEVPSPGKLWPGKYQKISRREEKRVANPFDVSLDAVRPFYLGQDGRTGIHVAGNLAFTTGWFNRGCNIFPKAVGPILARYIRNSSDADFDREAWNQDVRRVELLAASVPYWGHSRTGQNMSRCDFEEYDRALRTLHISEHGKGWLGGHIQLKPKNPFPTRRNWRPPGFERLEKLIVELVACAALENHSKESVKLMKGKDGCPYPFDPAFMPDNWSWWTAWVFFGERFFTCWLLCNGKYVQEDNIETMFLVSLWWYCSSHRSLFTLPINTNSKSPIRASIGRIEHGRAIVSGWPWDPDSMADWDKSRLNMSVETCFENWVKSNYHSRHYPQILQELLEVSLPPHIYDPQPTCTENEVGNVYSNEFSNTGENEVGDDPRPDKNKEAWRAYLTQTESFLMSSHGGCLDEDVGGNEEQYSGTD
ncbi:hypothetical protein FH972_024317 [Carpinus fangiana]|uniref:Uncharacterized protein n=1 Tax=Carpinus fangiana TaxID=176857 RepID=A0A5N6KYL0_9ROSI|nr:hypothetical protein FH972_024317 [Carpinus fangiana]